MEFITKKIQINILLKTIMSEKENIKMEIKKYNNYFNPKNKFYWIIQLSFIALFAILIHMDIYSNFFKLDSLGVSNKNINKALKYFIKVLGAYELIQVFSQDIGIKTGNYQIMITHHPIIRFILLFCTGFTLTGDRSESLVATILYFYLRNILSTELVDSSTWEK